MPDTTGQSHAGRMRRGGSVYIAVLGATMLVTVAGVSALLAVRIQLRAAEATTGAGRADIAAQSAVDLAMFRLSRNPLWRTTHTHGAWTAEITAGGAALSYRLVDERFGDLLADVNEPVRLYGKGTVGEATRVYSVLLQSAVKSGSAPDVLDNGDMEDGTTSWVGFPVGDADIASDGGDPHGGSKCIKVKNRAQSLAGLSQDVTAKLINGTTYTVELWVKMRDSAEIVNASLYVISDAEGLQFSLGPLVATTSWTKISGTLTPTWTGTLIQARWHVATAAGTQEFYVDDAVLVPQGSAAMIPIPGTWRREILP